jgi:putative ABC transport system permease protein
MNVPRWLRWRSDAELREEIQTHLEMEIQANLERGLSPQQARMAAQRRFGNAMVVRERAREGDPLFSLELVLKDVRYALRSLLRAPGFTLAACTTLALAIGASTAIFTVTYRVLLNPLPYPDSARILVLDFGNRAGNLPSGFRSLSSQQYFQYLDGARSLSSLAVYQMDDLTVSGRGAPERIRVSRVTPSLVSVLGVLPVVGRWFAENEAVPGAPPVAILSYGLWISRYGGDPAILGQSVDLDGVPAEVVGVMPRSYAFPEPGTGLLVPLVLTRATASPGYSLSGVARLRDGVTIPAARGELTRLTNDLEAASPGNGYRQFVSTAMTLIEGTVGRVSTMLWMLLASVGLLWLVACANAANLFLVRAEARQREVAMRRALGAGRGGIARVFLAESALVSIVGGAAGLVLAATATRLLVAFGPASLPRLDDVRLDAVGLLFMGALTAVTGLALGALPLLRVVWKAPSLQGGGRTNTGSRKSHHTRHALMASQVALALVLLVASGLLVRSFQQLLAVDPGFDPRSTLTLQVGLPPAQYPDRERVVAFHHAVLDRIAALPGVTAVSASTCLPLSREAFCFGNTLAVEGRPRQPGRIPRPVAQRAVAGGYFEAMGMHLLRGRGLDRADTDRREPVVVVDQATVDAYFPGEDPIGRRIAFGYGSSNGPWRTIVGVVASTVTTGLAELSPVPKLYLPMSTSGGPDLPVSGLLGPDISVMSYVVRASTPPLGLVPAVRRTIDEIDATVAMARLETLQGAVDRAAEQAAFTTVLLVLAAGVALLLGVVGIYGVVSYIVSQRTGEIGVRLALGAVPGNVAAMIVRQGGIVALAGVLVGLAAAFVGSRLITSLLYDVSPRDPAVFAATAVTLFGVAMLACWLPARRAARVSPVEALRAD